MLASASVRRARPASAHPRADRPGPAPTSAGTPVPWILLLGLALPTASHGQDPPTGGPDRAAAPADIVVVGVGPGTGLAASVVAAGTGRPDVRLSAFVLPPSPPPPAAPPIKAIKAALRRASTAFGSFDLDEAKRRLAEAQALLAPHSRSSPVLELEREAAVLDVTLAHAARDDRRLDAALSAYAQRFPGAGPPARTPWPPTLVARLAKKAPPREASLAIKTTPPGAELALDGEDVGRSPATITQLVAGSHRVLAAAPGRIAVEQTVELEAGAGAVLELELALDLGAALAAIPPGAPLPPDLAAAVRSATGRPQASLLLVEARDAGALLSRQDGAEVTARARSPRRTPADLRAALDGVLGPRLVDPAVAPAPAGAGPPTWAWIALGASVATAGAGIGTRVSAVSVEHELISRQGVLTQAAAFDIQSDAETRAAVGTALVVLGATVATCVAAWLVYSLQE